MSAEVHIAGEGCRLTLWLTGWETPALTSGPDAGWAAGEVQLTAGSTGRFSARHPVSIHTVEIARFRDELTALLDTLTGQASLDHLEGQVGAKITLKAGSGELEAFVAENAGAHLRIAGVRTDQSYLVETLRDLNAALEVFPVRGDPHS